MYFAVLSNFPSSSHTWMLHLQQKKRSICLARQKEQVRSNRRKKTSIWDYFIYLYYFFLFRVGRNKNELRS